MKKLAYIFVVLLVGVAACEQKLHRVSDVVKTDSVINAPLLAGDPDGTIALADSFERIGAITHIHASNRRGEAYLQKSMMTEADREFNSAVTGTAPKNQFDSVLYYSATSNIVQYMSVRRSNDSVIALAVPTLKAMKDFEYAPEFATEILVCKSMLYMYLGLAQRSLKRYAGHNPPVIGGGENKGDFLQMEANAPIGLFPEMDYQGEEMESIKGRALFIYTDGLNEAEDKEQHQFGDEKLLEILRDTHFDTAKQVVETLTEKVEEHRAGAEPNDDLTMLCLRVS